MSNENNVKLGITQVGCLLLDNKFVIFDNDENEKDSTKEIYNIELHVPEYQRPYKWSAEKALQLYYDIYEAYIANKEKYRLGTLIFHKEILKNKEKEEKDIYNIVDGQQRLITISLLLRCIINESDIKFLKQELKDNYYNKYNIYNNYKALDRQIIKLSDEEKNGFSDYVKQNCEFVIIITNEQSEAFQFFDSQNARGKSLYVHDLLKAYHLREMNNLDEKEVENIVKIWEELKQDKLSEFIVDCLYRLKEWIEGYKSEEIVDSNKDICVKKFKGMSIRDNFPYAQYYKGAYAYADGINNSNYSFVAGICPLKKFQINTPIIAGKAFFEYIKYYYDILIDIEDNSKYEGYFVNDNDLVKMIDKSFKWGTGNQIARKIFDLAILLYIDRFCPVPPQKKDIDNLNEFINCAFIWAYSLRFQYKQLGWASAKNYILGKEMKNSFNIYRKIIESRSPKELIGILSKTLEVLNNSNRDGYKESEALLKALKSSAAGDKINEEGFEKIDSLVNAFNKLKYWEVKDDE